MEYVKLGRTGLDVSRLCLGCMSFGSPANGAGGWTVNEDESRILIRDAVDGGINFFDTANIYSGGASEEILGRALKDFTRRDEVVVATKVCGPTRSGPNGSGLGRKAIFQEIDASLARLGMNHVDLYQVHRFDAQTPVEETLEALHDVVKAGKARYIGASSMYAWQFAKLQFTAVTNSWTRFVSMQNHLNLLHREEEREMMPFCRDQGVGIIPWSPLARGRLVRADGEETSRSNSDQMAKQLYGRIVEADQAIIQAVADIAIERNATRAQIALAWVLAQPGVTAPSLGVTRPEHLHDALKAFEIALTGPEMERLEAPYMTQQVAGFS